MNQLYPNLTNPYDFGVIGPSTEEWLDMTPEEQDAKEEEILKKVHLRIEKNRNYMIQDTEHSEEASRKFFALKQHFQSQGKQCLVASDLLTIYPLAPTFFPDLLVVFGVGNHRRKSYKVYKEKKGLDFVMEIVSPDHRQKDLDHISSYAKLNIPEYFLYDPEWEKIRGFNLVKKNAPYQEIEASQEGVFSQILQLYFRIEDKKLRIYTSAGKLLWSFEEFVQGYYEMEKAREEERKAREEERKAREEERKAKEEERKKRIEAESREKQIALELEKEKKARLQDQKELEQLRKLLQEQKPS